MQKQKVAILGCTGMLGSMILRTFASNNEFDLIATYRSSKPREFRTNLYSNVVFRKIDVEKDSLKKITSMIKEANWIINAVGIIKPYIHTNSNKEVERAIQINSVFPWKLAQISDHIDARVIQIATDCVFSGRKGNYIESDLPDAQDIYGKSKSLGEVSAKNIYNIRCSLIGPEVRTHSSLMDWLLYQPKNAVINGFTNHFWNGITTLHFAKICQGVIKNKTSLPQIHHLVPSDSITKAELLMVLTKKFGRKDIKIRRVKKELLDLRLKTTDPKLNQKLWRHAGYKVIPSITEMVDELSV
ncbi:MAG: SDR family oxidoreductase [Patescibacteria group bacterium]